MPLGVIYFVASLSMTVENFKFFEWLSALGSRFAGPSHGGRTGMGIRKNECKFGLTPAQPAQVSPNLNVTFLSAKFEQHVGILNAQAQAGL